MTDEEFLSKVKEERINQDKQWGGEDHDDSHSMADWANFIHKQAREAKKIDSLSVTNAEEFNDRMIKVAALALAATNSVNRRIKRHGLA